MHEMRKIVVLMIAALATGACGFAQTKPAPQTQKPATAQTPVQPPAYNPAFARHDLDVGKYYQKRGDLDGAIARYKDALRYKPNFAEPCLLLGQAYEQKHDFPTAISYYQQYMKILPNTSESKKLGKRIAELQEKMKKNEAGSE
jgi:tetratricopeptide (TPR) repeat protein